MIGKFLFAKHLISAKFLAASIDDISLGIKKGLNFFSFSLAILTNSFVNLVHYPFCEAIAFSSDLAPYAIVN